MYSVYFYPLKLADFIRLTKGTQPRERRLTIIDKRDDFVFNFIVRTHAGHLPDTTLQNVLIGV